tara:strand:+ start:238 stop:720 length:483 start_codon:yes stop_codon:yes gene_type:complete
VTSSNYQLKKGYRSGLEGRVAKELIDAGVAGAYEALKIPYIQPAKDRVYTPDFVLPNGVIVETKGIFTVEDRQKHLWVRDCHPELDIRFVFYNSRQKIRKGSKTTYAMWCDANSFRYADYSIPAAWIAEEKINDAYEEFFKPTSKSTRSSNSSRRGRKKR